MDTVQHFFADIKNQSFYLNDNSSRKLEICLKSIEPNLDFVFKLTAVDISCHVEFSKDTWNEMVKKSKEIRDTTECGNMTEVFRNTELKVFTETRYENCALCFVDQRCQRVNIMIATFKKMMSLSYSISTSYSKLLNDIKEIAEGMAIFIDTLVAKYQECEVENTAYWNYLSDLQNGIKRLEAHPKLPGLEIDDYHEYDDDDDDDDDNDNDESDSDGSYRHYRRRRYR